jgi:outer membrane receptor protein involved in Fe transport
MMHQKSTVAAAIAAILAEAAALSYPAPAFAQNPSGARELEEVTVTATRRSENLQDVPIAITALTGETLTQLNVTTFDDYVKYVPNVTAQGLGPGQNNIYMRGLATGVTGLQGSGVVGPFPNVAVYLDDQSAQVPGRNLDIYTADLERVEVLEGPQGTLFGAGAQAGVVRYITNKPKLDITEANFNAGYAVTAHGDPSNNLDATLNLPIIPDRFALRAVVYNESRGGYINNIPGTFARAATDLGIHYAYAGGAVPADSVVIDNHHIVGDAINSAVYKGVRLSGLVAINDDWNVLVAQSYQQLKADGVFSEMQTNSLGQPQPELSVQLYNPSSTKDKFENTSLTVSGRIGALQAVYAGSYLVRNVEQVQDYTNYARGPYVDYYQCVNPGPTAATAKCFTPSATWQDKERNTHESHEVRLSTPSDWRIRALGGLFYEDYKIQEQVDWLYKTATGFFNPVGPPTGYFTLNGSAVLPNGRAVSYNTPGAVFVPGPATSNNPNVRIDNVAFFDDITRGYTQKAAFGSIDFDIIPSLTLTLGTRYYRINSTEVGSAIGSFGCQLIFNPMAPNPCLNHSNGGNLDALGLDRTYTGFKSRGNLTWKITDDVLVYYTFSQGFRAGGFNRPNSVESGSPLVTSPDAIAHGRFIPPVEFKPDTLTNNEVGWKTEWLARRVQFNGAIYQERWKDAQIAIFDPGVTGNLTFSANGGTYRVRGLETTIVARPIPELTVTAAANWNQTELTEEARLLWGDGTPINFEALRDSKGQPLSNPGGTKGNPLAGAPPFQGNIRVRYDFPLAGRQAFVQVAALRQGHSLATTDRLTKDLQGNSIAYDLASFTTYDAAVGVSTDDWLVQLYGQNLSDERTELYANARQWYKAVTVGRPRTIGVRFSYNFTGTK